LNKKIKLKGCFLSESTKWRTPKNVIKLLTNEFGPLFDPCPVDPSFDGLKIDWKLRNYMNPPYGRKIGDWIKKGYEESLKGNLVIMLLPSRTDTAWFHDYVLKANEIRFIRGRLCFNDEGNPAPFPSMIVIFHGRFINQIQISESKDQNDGIQLKEHVINFN
jgi:site-specific DNA-methyltransferase (adenine-specific)